MARLFCPFGPQEAPFWPRLCPRLRRAGGRRGRENRDWQPTEVPCEGPVPVPLFPAGDRQSHGADQGGQRPWRRSLTEYNGSSLIRGHLCESVSNAVANELTRLHDRDGWAYFVHDANGNAVQEQMPTYTRYYDWDGRDMIGGGITYAKRGSWSGNSAAADGSMRGSGLLDNLPRRASLPGVRGWHAVSPGARSVGTAHTSGQA